MVLWLSVCIILLLCFITLVLKGSPWRNNIGVGKINALTCYLKWTWREKRMVCIIMEIFTCPICGWLRRWSLGVGWRVVEAWGVQNGVVDHWMGATSSVRWDGKISGKHHRGLGGGGRTNSGVSKPGSSNQSCEGCKRFLIFVLVTMLSIDVFIVFFVVNCTGAHWIKNKPISKGFNIFFLSVISVFFVNLTIYGNPSFKKWTQ